MKPCFLLFILLSFLGCKNHEQKAIITGKCSHASAEKIYFYTYQSDSDKYNNIKTIADSAFIGKDGSFYFELDAKKPLLFDLKNGDKWLCSNLYLRNGDELKLNFLGDELRPQIDSTTQSGFYNNYLLNYVKAFFEDPPVKYYYYVQSNHLSLAAFENYTAKRRDAQKQFYNNYFKTAEPDSAFSDFALSEIDYEYVNDNLMLYWKRRMKYSQNLKDSANTYIFLKGVKLMSPVALEAPSYNRFIHLFVNDKLAQLLEQKLPTSDLMDEKRKIAGKYFCGIFLKIAQSDFK